MRSKINTEDENKTRLNTLLMKESKRVGSENITAALQQKRIDEQKKRYCYFFFPFQDINICC